LFSALERCDEKYNELNRVIASKQIINDRYTITMMMISTIFIILFLLPIITTSYILSQWKRGDSLLSRRNELSSLYVTQDSNKLHGVQLNLSTVFPISKFLSEFASDSISFDDTTQYLLKSYIYLRHDIHSKR
jgi:hypothetical protein